MSPLSNAIKQQGITILWMILHAHLHIPCPIPCLLVQRLAQSPCPQGQLPPWTNRPRRPGPRDPLKLEQCRTPQRTCHKRRGLTMAWAKDYPLVNSHNYGKSTCLMGKSTINGILNGPFSMALCMFTRGYIRGWFVLHGTCLPRHPRDGAMWVPGAPGSSDWWGESPATIQAPPASIGPAVTRVHPSKQWMFASPTSHNFLEKPSRTGQTRLYLSVVQNEVWVLPTTPFFLTLRGTTSISPLAWRCMKSCLILSAQLYGKSPERQGCWRQQGERIDNLW